MATTKDPQNSAKGCIVIDEAKCKACGLCIHFCPQKNMTFAESINARGFHPVRLIEDHKCNGCAQCAIMCPDACIKVYRRK